MKTRQTTKELEERFLTTFEQAAVGIAHVTPDGKFIRINKKFCDITGYTKEEMTARTFQDITHPEDLSNDLEYYEQMLAREIETYSMEKRYIHKNKTIVWVNLTVSLVWKDNGDPDYFIAVVEDISERKQAIQDLFESETKYRDIVDNSLVGVFHTKTDGQFVFINEALAQMYDFDSPEHMMAGETLIHWVDQKKREQWISELQEHGSVNNFEAETISHKGRHIHILFSATLQADNILGMVMDISKRKEAEDRFHLLVEQAGDAFFVLDYKGSIFDVNRQACKSLGFSREELLTMNISEVDIEVTAMEHKQKFWNSLEPGQYLTIEGIHRRKDESAFPVEIRLGRLDLGEKKFLLALARDITERKQKEEELKKQVEFQELVSRISTKFIDLPADKIDQAINDQFEEIGKFFNADRVTIASMSENGEVLEASHMWFSDKINAEELAAHIKDATYPNFTDYIKTRTHWSFSNPDDFSHWHPEYETNENTKFKSGLAIKLNYDGFILDIFVIDVMHSNRVWTEKTIEQVNLLGHVFSNALNRKRLDEELRKNNEIQKLVSGIATKFSALTGTEFETAIHNTLGEIGKYFNSDTVRLYRLSLKGDVVKIRSMWRDERLAPPEEMPEIHKLKYTNLAKHYSKGESVVFSKYDESPEWPEMRKILKFFGTKAGVGVPIEIDDEGVDIFAMDKVQSENIWPENIISQSKIIGGVILSAMQRRDVEIQLQEHFDEIKSLKDQLETDNVYLRDEIKLNHNFEEIIGESSSLKYALHNVEKIAPVNTTVLLLGETGTGKELFARAIHNASPLKNRPVIKLNCATLPPDIIESELFGHEKGAFTGAHARQIGRFERADGTTIFLDEIGELPLTLQPKLLRVLQDGEFERLGGSKTLKTNVRVIAATNRNLEEEVLTGRFRSDLYYRLKVFPITIPPLRKRIEDLPLLVKFLVKRISRKLGKEITEIPNKAIEVLQNYSWPGNVRELENVIEGAVINSSGKVLRIELPKARVLEEYEAKTLEDVERDHITKILKLSNWRIEGPKGAAVVLGMNPGTLRSRMQKLGIEKPK